MGAVGRELGRRRSPRGCRPEERSRNHTRVRPAGSPVGARQHDRGGHAGRRRRGDASAPARIAVVSRRRLGGSRPGESLDRGRRRHPPGRHAGRPGGAVLAVGIRAAQVGVVDERRPGADARLPRTESTDAVRLGSDDRRRCRSPEAASRRTATNRPCARGRHRTDPDGGRLDRRPRRRQSGRRLVRRCWPRVDRCRRCRRGGVLRRRTPSRLNG